MLPRGYLIGNLSSDPTSGTSSSSTEYARFSVACNENYSKNSNEKPHFFNCVAWGQRAQFVKTYLKKGDSVFIEFTISTNSYTNMEGRVIKSIDLFVNRIEIVRRKNAEKKSLDSGISQISSQNYEDQKIKNRSQNNELDIFEEYSQEEISLDNISLDDIYSE